MFKKLIFTLLGVSLFTVSVATEVDWTLYSALNEDSRQTYNTRYGVLSTDDEGILQFQGKKVQPVIQANNMLIVKEIFPQNEKDIILMEIIGGSGCPASYHFVTLSKNKISATEEFGSCSDLIKVKETGNKIIVSMPFFVAHEEFFTKKELKKAYSTTMVYEFENGGVREFKRR